MNKTILVWLALLLVFSGGMTVWMGWKAYQQTQAAGFGGVLESEVDEQAQPLQIDPFSLTERSGRAFHSDELQGEVFVTSFFFANCPSICRMQNSKIQELADEFGPQGATFVSITCDPENDTPEALSRYADLFNADPQRWLFLTGELDELQRIGEMVQVSVNAQTHSERLIVVDRSGTVRGRFSWNDDKQVAMLKRTLTDALAEEPPGDKQQQAAAGEPPEWLTHFTLTERNGQPFDSQDLDGHPYVASFFFTNCPSVCRIQNQKLQQLQQEFQGQDLKLLSITCDPQRDTPEVLSRYAKMFHADPENWLFLTGELNYIRRVGAEMFRVPVNKEMHSEKLIVVDREGEIRGTYHWNRPKEWTELRQVLKEVVHEAAEAS